MVEDEPKSSEWHAMLVKRAARMKVCAQARGAVAQVAICDKAIRKHAWQAVAKKKQSVREVCIPLFRSHTG